MTGGLTEPRLTLHGGSLTLNVVLPEHAIRACVSRGGVLHLHRPHAGASVCGRQDVGRARVADRAEVFSMQAHGARTVCPYCLAWAQGATAHQRRRP